MVGLVFSVLEVVAVVNHMLVAHMQAMVVPGADMRLEVVVQEVMVQVAQVQMEPQESLVAVIAQKLLPTKDGKGRVPACEVMIATTAIRNLIRQDRIYQIVSLMQSGGVDGMQTLDQDLQRLVSQGEIDRATAEAVADNPKLFRSNVL